MDNHQNATRNFWDMLEQGTQAALRHMARVGVYSDGQLIHNRGDERPGISIVKSGGAQVGTLGVDGSFMSIAALSPGDPFGEFTLFVGLPRTHDISAIGETEIYQVPAQGFMREYRTRPDISHALLVTTLRRSHILLETVDDMKRLSLPVRIAKYLTRQANQTGNYRVQCQQTDIAQALGVSRVSIGKGLKGLIQKNFVTQGYGEITLHDIESINQWIKNQSMVTPVNNG